MTEHSGKECTQLHLKNVFCARKEKMGASIYSSSASSPTQYGHPRV